ncbi:glycosyltransferase [Candidatus Parcubacteria bacterium]|nr:MAG: glycosyltransferase [Candidatus Parcubacteria bacterium]
MIEHRTVWNVPVASVTADKIIRECVYRAQKGNASWVVICANPHSQVMASKDDAFMKAFLESDVVLPDGVGTVIAGRLLGTGVKNRLTGPDFFSLLSQQLNTPENQCSYFFFGASQSTVEGIKKNMAIHYPHIPVAGALAPPFREFTDMENERMVAEINRSNPSVLWVGMTAPKQEKWIAINRHKLKVPLIAAIGAEFDYFAGSKTRPPEWVRKIGMQWLYRFLTEPLRTWRRHVVSMPVFMAHIFLLWGSGLLSRKKLASTFAKTTSRCRKGKSNKC